MPPTPPESSPLRAPVAALLTWLLPGAGHIYIGERVRGIVFLVAITLTFWTGVAIGGVKKTVDPDNRTAWFAGQICAGGHTLATLTWSRLLPKLPPGADPSSLIAYGPSEEVSVVYTGICGMLNILIIFDVLVRAERQRVGDPPPARAPAAVPVRKATG